MTEGGASFFLKHQPAETKEKLRKHNLGKRPAHGYSLAVRQKISLTSKGRRHTDETKAVIAAASKARRMSPETRLRMSEAAKRRPKGPRGPRGPYKRSA